MKTLLLIVLLLIAVPACADPFLACSPSLTPITTVEVEITHAGVTTVRPGVYILAEPDAKILDLAGFENGAYTFRARWGDVWMSDWSDPLPVVKSGKPVNFRIK